MQTAVDEDRQFVLDSRHAVVLATSAGREELLGSVPAPTPIQVYGTTFTSSGLCHPGIMVVCIYVFLPRYSTSLNLLR